MEDDPDDAHLFGAHLRRAGIEVRHVVSSVGALRQLHDTEISLALVDVTLPDGFELDSLWVAREAFPMAAIVMLTGHEDQALALRALRAGAEDYVLKRQVGAEVLARIVRYAVARQRAATERLALIQELDQARKLEAVGRLASGIAHEINTPTQFIGDNLEFVQDAIQAIEPLLALAERAVAGEPVDCETWREIVDEPGVARRISFFRRQLPLAVEQAREGVGRVSKIVRAMKEFAHPSRGKLVATDLVSAIETTVTVASNAWRYAARVETSFAADLEEVPCVRDEMNQVFLNLLINAAHAIEDAHPGAEAPAGTIRIVTRRAPPFAEILFQDDGVGIDPALQPRLFEPFFTTKEPGRGTGQGLALAYAVVVQRHAGAIDIESAPGEGTTVTIRLPLEVPVHQAA